MKKIRTAFFTFFLSIFPLSALADEPLESSGSNGLVPDCFGPFCRACDLVTLSNNVINFGIAFSVIVATLMFAYAGILYVTAAGAGAEQVKKAHKIFVNIFVGLLVVLLAWLLVNITFSVLTGKGLADWTKIQCVNNPITAPFDPAEDRGVGDLDGIVGGRGDTPGVTNPNDNLQGVHPDLVCLVNAAHGYSTVPFVVTSGFRESSSTATDSRHLYGLAVDAHPVIDGVVDVSHGSGMRDGNAAPNANYQAINAAFVRARQDCNNVQFQWGGSSPTFMGGRYYDSMHFQLLRSQYPNR